MANLLDMIRGMLTPDLGDQLAARHGENRGTIDTLLAAAPALLLTGLAHTPADRLEPLVRAAAAPSADRDGDGSPDEDAGLIERLFGARAGGMADALAGHAGASAASAIGVLGLLVPLVGGAIGRALTGAGRPVDTANIAGLLRDNQDDARAALPLGLRDAATGAFGIAPASTVTAAAPLAPAAVATPVLPAAAAVSPAVAATSAGGFGVGIGWVAAIAVLLTVFALWWGPRNMQGPEEVQTRVVREQPGADIPASPAPIDVDATPAIAAPPERAEYTVDTCNEDFRDMLSGRTVNFATASAESLPDSIPLLDALAVVAARCGVYKIEIAGHTDSVGDAAANRDLSRARADAVRDYLANNNVPAEQMTTVGYGEDRPVEKTADETENAANRRIEFTVSQ